MSSTAVSKTLRGYRLLTGDSSLQVLDPVLHPGWDQLLASTPGAIFFHHSSWAKVLKHTYGYTPLYLARIERGRFAFLVPLMEVKSLLTGRRGVSLPFTDFCPFLPGGGESFLEVARLLTGYGKELRWRYLELRDGPEPEAGSPPSSTFWTHTLDLSGRADTTYARFRSSTRRNIQKAIREGVEVARTDAPEGVRAFYDLNCRTRKRHGLPPQPYRFFRNVYQEIIRQGLGAIFLARHSGRIVSGAVFFHLGGKAIYKYGASDYRYQDLRPNNLVMWEAIRWYCERHFEELNFGRTEPDNEGLCRFKEGWGAEQAPLRYYKYDFAKARFVGPAPSPARWQNRIFGRMPQPLLNLTGAILYRHVG
ncbi:MAG: GNAT family N-acetyltransferase [bacterium]